MLNPEHYRRGPILVRGRLLTLEATEVENGSPVYVHLFPVGRDEFQNQLTNDVLAWLTSELSIEEYKGATYIVSPARPEYLEIETYIHESVERARSKYETQVTKISEPIDNETAEYPTTAQ